jgi:hypothetical protein
MSANSQIRQISPLRLTPEVTTHILYIEKECVLFVDLDSSR